MWVAGEPWSEWGMVVRPIAAVGSEAALGLGAGAGADMKLTVSIEWRSCLEWDGDSGGECGKGNVAPRGGSNCIRKVGLRCQPRLGRLLGRRGVRVGGRLCTGAKAGIRYGKWSVIMDWLTFEFLRTRRVCVRLAVATLHKRESVEIGLTRNLPRKGRGWGAETRVSATVGAVASGPLRGACESEMESRRRSSPVGGSTREECGAESATASHDLGTT